jgi:hypothetical protein
MADPKYRGRRQEVILPSPKILEKWKSEAAVKGLSVSSWILETVEGRDIDTASRSADAQEIKALRDQVRTLKKERDATLLELEKERTALFKLKHATLLQPSGQDQIERNIIDALRRGGVWNERDLLKELNVDSHDIDAIKLITKQLEILQICDLVEETVKGWKWIK